jgi:hypothetical protein
VYATGLAESSKIAAVAECGRTDASASDQWFKDENNTIAFDSHIIIFAILQGSQEYVVCVCEYTTRLLDNDMIDTMWAEILAPKMFVTKIVKGYWGIQRKRMRHQPLHRCKTMAMRVRELASAIRNWLCVCHKKVG